MRAGKGAGFLTALANARSRIFSRSFIPFSPGLNVPRDVRQVGVCVSDSRGRAVLSEFLQRLSKRAKIFANAELWMVAVARTI